MNLNQTEKDNLGKGLGLFIEAFRPYIVSILQPEAGEKWPGWFFDCLNPGQKEAWNQGIKAGTKPEALIDFHHLKSFAIRYKELLKEDFEKKTGDLPNMLGAISEARNKFAHFQEIDRDESTLAWIHMIAIAKILKMQDLEHELESLRSGKQEKSAEKPGTAGSSLSWFHVVTPHLDIRQGRLDESVFAANLGEVALGSGREIYINPVVFFSKTFLTRGLKTVTRRVINGLNGKEDAENRVISLQTSFGGGKTHMLISLYHLCKWGRKSMESSLAARLFESAGVPEFETASIAAFTNTTNDPANGRKTSDGVHIRTLWGELAYQLGGKEAYEIIRKNDELMTAPAGRFKQILEQCKPALILIDELADYCVKASGIVVGSSTLADQTISFMQELTESISMANHCVAVITMPASAQEVGNSANAQQILVNLQKRVSRVGADTQPVDNEEIFDVLRSRLFEDTGAEQQRDLVISKYVQYYQELWTELPKNANQVEYKDKLRRAYPFHPELIDMFRIRWASHHDFQRTRGVLRLLASIVSDLWNRQQSLTGSNYLIQTTDVNFANLDALSGQLKKLYGNGYDAVITADVSGSSSNAFKIDAEKKEFGRHYLAQGIASTVLLGSFGNDGANRGLSIQELKLCAVKPESFNHNNINAALDELEANAHYLYYAQAGSAIKRYWFHTKPNINILITKAKGDVETPDIEAEIIRRINARKNNINFFNVLVSPSEDVPEQQKITLVILHPSLTVKLDSINGQTKKYIEKLATKRGNNDRIFRNTILFLAPTEIGMGKLNSDIREFLACQKISADYQTQLEREQKEDLRKRMEEASKSIEGSIVVAYSAVLKHSAKHGIESLMIRQYKDYIDSQVNAYIYDELKKEEWLLESVGLSTLKANELFPDPDNPIKARDVYEAFIRFDDKPMITGEQAIQKSLLRYCHEGQFAIANGDGKTFSKYYLGKDVPWFDVKDDTYWLIDKSQVPQEKPPIPEGGVQYPPAPPVETVENGGGQKGTDTPGPGSPAPEIRKFKKITISGKVPLENYSELFGYFITPFAMSGNKPEIEVKFTIKSTEANTLDETRQQYKNAKEAAKQLGLGFEEE
ncbi:MAG: ATP-binding protein [Bacteroidales bacterium]|nr:ATP-binding protein [Bacteroidales bacterium]